MKKTEGFKEKVYEITHPILIPATFPQKAADKVTKGIGSWTFITLFLIILVIWVWAIFYTANESLELDQFLLLNLVLSCIAAIQAPIILMSQNRAGQKERQRMEYDYQLNKKSEREIEQIQKQLNRIETKLNERR